MSKIVVAALVVVTALAFAPVASAGSSCPSSCGFGSSGDAPSGGGFDPTQNPCRPTCASLGGR